MIYKSKDKSIFLKKNPDFRKKILVFRKPGICELFIREINYPAIAALTWPNKSDFQGRYKTIRHKNLLPTLLI